MSVLTNSIVRLRDGFASAVLGTTSSAAPDLAGGLPVNLRILLSASAMGLSALLAFAYASWAGAFGALFLLPGLMIAGLFGGVPIALVAYAFAVAFAAALLTNGPGAIAFAAAAALQTFLALGLRALFRESRRWGVRYRRLLNTLTSCVIVSDPSGQILRPQPDFGRIIGMEWPEYKGMGWLTAVHPEDMQIGSSEPGARPDRLVRNIRLRDGNGDWRWYQFRSVPVPGRDGKPEEMISALVDIHNRKLGQEARDLIAGETRHRWKNLMTVINALAVSSLPQDDASIGIHVQKFLGRLRALSAAGDEALAAGGQGASIEAGAVIRATLAPFIDESATRIVIHGPRCLLSEATSASLALGMHELATNAIKYGALSVPEGRVEVRWRKDVVEKTEQIVIEWIERGGPPPAAPNHEGFGTRVIKFVPAREANGAVDLDYRPEGLYCRISFQRAREPEVLGAV